MGAIGHLDYAIIRISEAKDGVKQQKKLRTQINGKFNGILSVDDKK
jgi:hypothetical protein